MSTLQQRICGRTAVPRRFFAVAALSAWFAVVLILAAPVATHAEVFMVTDEGDSGPGTLRAAIQTANLTPGSDLIEFNLPTDSMGNPQEISLTTGVLTINDSVRIINDGPRNVTVRRAELATEFSVFKVLEATTVSMHGLTILNGLQQGAGVNIQSGATVIMSSMYFNGNSAESEGGVRSGGAISNSGELSVVGGTFHSNRADFTGAAIDNSGTLFVANSTFIGNTATGTPIASGGGIQNHQSSRVTIQTSSFCRNEAAFLGGGIDNQGTIALLLGNLLVDNNVSFAKSGPDLFDGGVISTAIANTVESPMGHMLDPILNEIGTAQLCEIGDHGGPVLTTTPPAVDTPAHDSGSAENAPRFDQRGGFRNRGLVPDAGATESGNLFFLESGDWLDAVNWSSLTTPLDEDAVWINRGVNAFAGTSPANPASYAMAALGVGSGGDVNAGQGNLTVNGVDYNVATEVGIGTAFTEQAVHSNGFGTAEFTDANVSTQFALVGSALAFGNDKSADAEGGFSMISAAFPISLNVDGATTVGSATSLGSGTTTHALGSLIIEGEQANMGDFLQGFATADGDDDTVATVVQGEFRYTGSTLNTASWNVGQSTSSGGRASVETIESHTTAETVISNVVNVGNVSTSARPDGAMPEASIDQIHMSVDTTSWTINNGLSVSQVSGSGSGPATASIGEASVTVDAGTLSASIVIVGAVQAASEVIANNGPASLTITGADTTVSGFTSIGNLTLSNGANGTSENATLHIVGGSYTAAGGPFGSNMNIGNANAFTPVEKFVTQALVHVEGATLNVEDDVRIGTTNSAGANQPSSADGELQLTDSRATIGGDVIVGIDGGISIIHSGVAIIRSNPSFLDIAGDLVLGDRAVLDLGIEGLTRPDETALGTYSAIDAANATLDGELRLSFDFPNAAVGDSFELIRLDENGSFTSFFDETTVTGLTGGLTADAAIMGNSLFATIILGAAMLDGDYNNSGAVEQGDLDLVLLTWGNDVTVIPPPDVWINQRPADGIIGQAHLDAVLLNWGNSLTAGSIAAIPEPTSCSLVLVFGGVYTAWLAATRQIPIRPGGRSANVAPTADVS